MMALSLVLLVQGCAGPGPYTVKGEPISGQVIESGSGRAIEGAIVLARWRGSEAYSSTVCFHSASAITDSEGRYFIPAWEKKHRFGNSSDQNVLLTTYKTGYQIITQVLTNRISLSRDTRPQGKRLRHLLEVLPGCYSEDESEENLLPMYRAVYDEGQSLAVTKEDKEVVESILYSIEIIELGYQAAQERHYKRFKSLR